ncbi:MAG: hypothetical protein Q8N63_01030 [Nanoarchaeota archaeon]|nr:hypothetical protein [Nanoarchaeota archaeon]
MKTQKLILIAISLLFIGGALAQVTEGNFFKYGEIDADGNVIGSINPIENVSVIGFVCENENCESVSKRLWSNILNTITDYIQLIYPTSLLSPNGYGIYMFKPGYIPFEVHVDWAGNGDAGDYDNYLTKKQLCISKIETLDVSHDGENTNVDVFVNSPLKSFGPLDYVPAEIEEHYKTNVIVNLKVYENSSLFYEETKSKNILPSQGNFEFSFPADEGVYEIKITTSVNDLKCLDFEEDTEEKSIEVSIDECYKDADCNEDYTSEAYCLENDIFKNFHDFSCVQGTCKENIVENLLNECANGCIYGECIMECSINTDCGNDFHSENYCLNGDVYNDFHDSICDHNQCFEDTFPELVKECTDGCANGDCVNQEEPECGNEIVEEGEECDDGNLINGDGCDSNCINEKECCDDENCPADYYGANYCLEGDVYYDLNDFFCSLTGTCEKNIFTELKQDCGEDYCDEWNYYCEGKNKIRERTCYDKGCDEGECFANSDIEKQSEECTYGCENGDCILETCSSDNDCPNDTYTDEYCAEGDVYRDFADYSCNNGSCSVNMTKKLFEECDYGCGDGECEEKDNEDDGDGDMIDKNKRIESLEDDKNFNAFENIDYSMFNPIDLTTKSDAGISVSKKIPFWLWILAALVLLLFIILLILAYRRK